MTLGERIKKVRKASDLTQQKFADRLGMKQNTVATYEMGRTNPSDPAIKSICREFNVNETWLRTGEGEMFVKYPNTALEALAVDFYLDAFDEALVDEYIHLTPNQRKTFRTFFYRVLIKSAGDAGLDELLQAEMCNYPTTRIRDDISAPPPPVTTEPEQAEADADGLNPVSAEFEAEARAKAELYYQQLLSEQEQAKQASSAKERGAG